VTIPQAPLPRQALLVLLLLLSALACAPEDPPAEARALLAAGEHARAIALLRDRLAERPGDGELQLLYGQALVASGQSGLAEWPLREAMKDERFVVPAGLQVAYQSVAQGNYSAALEVLARVLEASPDNLAALSLRANAHAQSRLDPEAALADAARMMELEPDALDAFKPRILAYLQLEREEEASQAIDELGERLAEPDAGTPDLRGWHCATAAIFAEESRDAELALSRWNACLEEHPTHGNVVRDAVAFFESRRDLDRTIDILRHATAAGEAQKLAGVGQYRVSLAERLVATGAEAEAEALLVAATQNDDPARAAAATVDLARHYDRQGRLEEAVEAAERGLRLTREMGTPRPEHLFETADLLLRAGEVERALELADEMSLEAHRELVRARAAQAQGRHEDALAHYDKAGRLWPNNAFARYHAARSAEALGQFDQAIELYRHSSRIDLGATDARGRAALILDAQGDSTQALETLTAQVGRAALSGPEAIVALRLRARGNPAKAAKEALPEVVRAYPQLAGAALAAVAEGMRQRGLREQAVTLLAAQGDALLAPGYAEALRKWIELAAGSPGFESTGPRVRAAVASRPQSAAIREIEGIWIELGGGPPEDARAAYARALELESERGIALAHAGRLALDTDFDGGIALLERAVEAEPLDEDTLRAAAAKLQELGRGDAAESLLEGLIARVPYERRAALALASMRLARGDTSDRTLDLAKRAARFGAGAPGYELLQRVHAERGEEALAATAGENAATIRARLRAREEAERAQEDTAPQADEAAAR